MFVGARVCVRGCARVCVRGCARVCVRGCARVCARGCARVCVRGCACVFVGARVHILFQDLDPPMTCLYIIYILEHVALVTVLLNLITFDIINYDQ